MIHTLKPGTKPRTCKNRACRNKFVPARPLQAACCVGCAIIISKDKLRAEAEAKAKAERQNDRKRKEAIRPRKWWKAKAKTALHAYIRARDEGKTCISCETILIKLGRVGGDYDAGHFRSVGSAKHMEFVENNIHGQCRHCNDYLAGNPAGYESGLIARHGVEYVEALKNDNEPRHLKIEDFQAIEVHYKAKLKALAVDKGVA